MKEMLLKNKVGRIRGVCIAFLCLLTLAYTSQEVQACHYSNAFASPPAATFNCATCMIDVSFTTEVQGGLANTESLALNFNGGTITNIVVTEPSTGTTGDANAGTTFDTCAGAGHDVGFAGSSASFSTNAPTINDLCTGGGANGASTDLQLVVSFDPNQALPSSVTTVGLEGGGCDETVAFTLPDLSLDLQSDVTFGSGAGAAAGFTPAHCGNSDGSLQVAEASGNGCPPIMYDIGGPSQATPSFCGLAAGTYTVTATDDCGFSSSVMITIPDDPGAVTSTVGVEACSGSPADVTATSVSDATDSAPTSSTILWFSDAAATTQIGMGSPFDASGFCNSTIYAVTEEVYNTGCDGADVVCLSAAVATDVVCAPEFTVELVKTKCDGNPDGNANPTDDVDEYTYEVIVSFSGDPGAATIDLGGVGAIAVAGFATTPGQLVYIFSSDPANPFADDTSLPVLLVTDAGTLTATVSVGPTPLLCTADFEVAAEVDCSCFRNYCTDVTNTADAGITTPDGPLTPPVGTNPLLETIYVLTDPSGAILQTDDVDASMVEFDMSTLAPTAAGGVLCEVWAVNFDSSDPDAAAYVAGALDITALCYPPDPCLCIDVSCSACYINKLEAALPPITTAACVCQGDPSGVFSLLADCDTDNGAGSTITWYLDDMMTVVATGPSFDPVASNDVSTANPGITTFFAQCTNADGCSSPFSAPVNFEVKATPEAPDPIDVCICADDVDGDTPILVNFGVVAGGATFNVYADAAGGAPLASGLSAPVDVTAFVNTTMVGIQQLFITEFVTTATPQGDLTCESDLALFELEVIMNPDPTVDPGPFYFCNNDDGTNLNDLAMPATAGGEWIVYDSATMGPSGSAVPPGIVPADFAPGTYEYIYVVTAMGQGGSCPDCSAQSEPVTIVICEVGDPTWTSPGSYCSFESADGIALDPFVSGGVTAANSWSLNPMSPTTGGAMVTDNGDGTGSFAISDASAITECVLYTITHTVTIACPGSGFDCVESEDQILEVCPEFDPTFITECVCCDEDGYWLPGGTTLTNPGGLQDLPGITTVDPSGSWSGTGVFYLDNDPDGDGDPFTMPDGYWYFDPRVDDPVGTLTPLVAGATGQFITSEGEWTIQFEVGDQPCENEYVLDFDVSCPVDVTLNDDQICLCGCGEYDLTQLFNPTTTQGGLWCLDPGVNPNIDPAVGGIDVAGDILSYDPTQITEATTVFVKYSVGNACAGGNCVGVGTTSITLVPKPAPDFDLPDAVCTLEALVLQNYVVQPSNGTFAAAPESFSLGTVTAATGMASDVTIVDGVLLMANGFTGDIEVCYDEVSTDPVSGLDCSVSDCEVITVGDISANVTECDTACVSSSSCFDLEQLFTDTTTQGGIFFPLDPTQGGELNGTNLCYDPAEITDVTTIEVVYSVAADPTQVGTTCIRLDTAKVTIVPQPEVDMDLGDSCGGETISLYDYIVSPSTNDTGDDGSTAYVSTFTVTDVAGADLSGTILIDNATGIVDFGGYTGLAEICYTETVSILDDVDDTIELFACSDTDCEVIRIYDVNPSLLDVDTVCVSSSQCIDLESFYTPTTTTGGTFSENAGSPLPEGFNIQGTNLCYDPSEFENPTTVCFDYTIDLSPENEGSTCSVTTTACVTITFGVQAFLDLPEKWCSDDTLCLLANYLSLKDANGDVIPTDGALGDFQVVATNTNDGTGFTGNIPYDEADLYGGVATNDNAADASTLFDDCYIPSLKFEGFVTIRVTVMDPLGQCMVMAEDNIEICRGGTADFKTPAPVCEGDGVINLTDLTTDVAPYPYNGDGTPCGEFIVFDEDGNSVPLATVCTPPVDPGMPEVCTYEWDPAGYGGQTMTIRYIVGSGVCADSIDMLVPVCSEVTAEFELDTLGLCEGGNKPECFNMGLNNTPAYDTTLVLVDHYLIHIDTVYQFGDTALIHVIDTIQVEEEVVCQKGHYELGPGLVWADSPEDMCIELDGSDVTEGFTSYVVYVVGKNLDYDCDGAPDAGFDCSTPEETTCFDKDTLFITIEPAKFDPFFALPDTICSDAADANPFAIAVSAVDTIVFGEIDADNFPEIKDSVAMDDIIVNFGDEGDELNMQATVPDELVDVLTIDDSYFCGPKGKVIDMYVTINYHENDPLAQGDHSGFNVVGPGGAILVNALDNELPCDPNPNDPIVSGDSNDDAFTCLIPFADILAAYDDLTVTANDGQAVLDSIMGECVDKVFTYSLITNAAGMGIDLGVYVEYVVIPNCFNATAYCHDATDSLILTEGIFTYDTFNNQVLLESSDLIALANAECPGCPVNLVIENTSLACFSCEPTFCDTMTIMPALSAELVCNYEGEGCATGILDLQDLFVSASGGGVWSAELGDGTPVDAEGGFIDGSSLDFNGKTCIDVQVFYSVTENLCNGEFISSPCEPASDSTFVTFYNPTDSLFTSNASPFKCIGTDTLCIYPDACLTDIAYIAIRNSEDLVLWDGTAFHPDAEVVLDTTYNISNEGDTCETIINVVSVCLALTDVDSDDIAEDVLNGLWHIVMEASFGPCGPQQFSQDVFFVEEIATAMIDTTICGSLDDYNLGGMVLLTGDGGMTFTPQGGFFTLENTATGTVTGVNGTEISPENMDPGAYIVTYSAGSGGNCYVSDQAILTIIDAPNADFTHNASPAICVGQDLVIVQGEGDLTVTTDLTITNGATIDILADPTTVVDAATSTVTYNIGDIAPGLYTVCHTVSVEVNGITCDDTYCVDILVSEEAIAIFSPDSLKVCESISGGVDMTQFLEITSTDNADSGFVLVDEAGVPTPDANILTGNTFNPFGLATGYYYVQYSTGVDGTASECVADDVLTIWVVPAATGEFAYDDAYCLPNSMIAPVPATDPPCNDEGFFVITDGSGAEVASFDAGGDYTPVTAGLYEICYTTGQSDDIGDILCPITNCETVEVCEEIDVDVEEEPDFCEGYGLDINLWDYLTGDENGLSGTWTLITTDLGVVVLDSTTINVGDVAAGSQIIYNYFVEGCNPACDIDITFTIDIEESKWDPGFDLVCSGCDGTEAPTVAETNEVGDVFLCSDLNAYDLDFHFGDPIDTIVFSGYGIDVIETTEGSNFQPANPNIGDGSVCLIAPEDYFCGRRNQLLNLEFTYNYVGLPDPFDPSIITNGDYDSLYISGPGGEQFCVVSGPDAPSDPTYVPGQPGIPVITSGNPGNPDDETFPDITIPYEVVLLMYDDMVGDGQAYLDSLFSSCEALVFNYYLVTRAAPVSIELTVVADVEVTKNSAAAYDAAGNALPAGHFVIDESGNATFAAQVLNEDCSVSDAANLPQPITIVDTTFECSACADPFGLIHNQDIYVSPAVNADINDLADFCAEPTFTHANLTELFTAPAVDEDGNCIISGSCTGGGTSEGGTWTTDRGIVEIDPNGNALLDVSSVLPTDAELEQCFLDVQVTYTAEGATSIVDADGNEVLIPGTTGCGDCESASDNGVIRVYIPPTEIFTSNASPYLCVGDDLTIDISDKLETVTSVTVVNGSAVEVFADANGDYNYTIPADHNGAPFEGLYTIVVTGTFGPCSVTEEENIFIVGTPDATINDLTACEGNINLTGMVPAGSTPMGSWSVNGSAISGDESEFAAGDYTITYSVGTLGCSAEGTATLTVVPGPDASFTTNGQPFICVGTDLSVTPIGTGTTTGLTVSAGGTVINDLLDTGDYSTDGMQGLYTITHTVENTENGITCTDEASIDVFIIVDPDATLVDTESCEGVVNLTTMLDADATPGGSFNIVGLDPFGGNEVDLAAGSYTVTYTVGAAGCEATASATLTVLPYNDPTATVQETVCAGGEISIVPNGSLGTVGGTIAPFLTGDPINGFAVNANTPEGLYSFIHTTSDPCGGSATYYLFVYGAPTAAWASILNDPWASDELCIEDAGVDLTQYLESESTSGGDFTGTGVNGNTFYPNQAGAGTHTVTYSVATPAGCAITESTVITVLDVPNPGFDVPSQAVCLDCYPESGWNLNPVTDYRQEWSVEGPAGWSISASNVFSATEAGTYTITHTVSVGFSCVETSVQTIEVAPEVEAMTDPNTLSYCVADPTVFDLGTTLTAGSTLGGMWFDADGNAVDANVNIADLATGAYVYTYEVGGETSSCDGTATSFVNQSNCYQSANVTIIINEVIDASFEIVDFTSPVCGSDTETFDIVPSNGPFAVSACDSDTSMIVSTAPTAEVVMTNLTANASFNLTNLSVLNAVTISLTYAPDPNPNVLQNPAAHQGYSLVGPDGTVILVVTPPSPFEPAGYFGGDGNPTPSVTLDYEDLVAAYGGEEELQSAFACTSGEFQFNLNSNSAQYYIALDVCIDYLEVPGSFTVNGETNSGFVSLDVENAEFVLNTYTEVDTTFEICYTTEQCDFNNGGCSATSCQEVTIYAPVSADILDAVDPICEGLSVFFLESLLTPSTTIGGSWSLDAASEAAGAGIYNESLLSLNFIDFGGADFVDVTVTYTVTGTPPCPDDSDSVTIRVYNGVEAGFFTNASPSICSGDTLIVTTFPSNGGTSVLTVTNNGTIDLLADAGITVNDDGTTTYTYDIPADFAGLYYITHTVTNGACEDTEVTPIYVVGEAVVELAADIELCENEIAELNLLTFLSDETTGGGTFFVNGVPQPGSFVPVVGTNTVVYQVGQFGGACEASDEMIVTVNPSPDLSFILTDICAGSAAIDLTGMTFTVDGVEADSFDPSTEGTFVITATNMAGCSTTTSVNVYGTPELNLPADLAICEGEILNLDELIASSGSTAGGTWSGFQVEFGDYNSTGTSAYYFDGNDLGGFTNLLTYTVGTGDCEASTNIGVLIHNPVNANFFVPTSLCSDDEPYTLVGTGVFTDEAGNVITEFDPSQGAGTYQVTHTVTDGGCSASATLFIEVFNGTADAGWCVIDSGDETVCNDLYTFCDADANGEITLVPNNAGGVWTCANGAFGNLDPATGSVTLQYEMGDALSASFAVTYEIPGSCGSTGTKVINVFAGSEAPEASDDVIYGCLDAEGEAVTISARTGYDIIIVWANADKTEKVAEGEAGEDYVFSPGILSEEETSYYFSSRNSLTGCGGDVITVTWIAEEAPLDLSDIDMAQCGDNSFGFTLECVDGATYTLIAPNGDVTTSTDCSFLVEVDKKSDAVIYQAYYTTANGGCESNVATITLISYDAVFVTYTVLPNQTDDTYDIVFVIDGGCGESMFNGEEVDGFSYTVTDIPMGEDFAYEVTSDCGAGCMASGTVLGPEASGAVNDSLTTSVNSEIICINVMSNDPGAVSVVSFDAFSELGGEVVLSAEEGCVFNYFPPNDACNVTDSFTYTVVDGDGNESTATVYIDIVCAPIEFEAYPELVCNKEEGTWEYVVPYINAEADYTFNECGGASQLLEGVPVITISGIEGGSVCLEIYDGDGNLIYDFAVEVVSCVKTAIELISFDGEVQESGNRLFWSTASEIDNDYFTLERSFDGVNFSEIATQDGKERSNVRVDYTEMDYTAPAGISYYRLLVTDLDGLTEVASRVIALERTTGEFLVNEAPVPSSELINVTFDIENTNFATVRIIDVAGKLIEERTVETETGLNNLTLDIRAYAAGTYFLTVTRADETATTRFIKE